MEENTYQFPPIDWLVIAIEALVQFIVVLTAMIFALVYMQNRA